MEIIEEIKKLAEQVLKEFRDYDDKASVEDLCIDVAPLKQQRRASEPAEDYGLHDDDDQIDAEVLNVDEKSPDENKSEDDQNEDASREQTFRNEESDSEEKSDANMSLLVRSFYFVGRDGHERHIRSVLADLTHSITGALATERQSRVRGAPEVNNTLTIYHPTYVSSIPKKIQQYSK